MGLMLRRARSRAMTTASVALCTFVVEAHASAQSAGTPQTQPAPQTQSIQQTQPAAQTQQVAQAPQTPQTPQTPQAPQTPQTPQTPQGFQPAPTQITSAPIIVAQPPPPATVVQRDTTSEEYRPNRKFLIGGVLTLGLSYAPAAVVGSTSDHEGDRSLLVPVVGPWIDLGDRGPCNGSGEPRCSDDTANRVLIAIDGVVQGVAVLQIVSAFIWPERHRVEVVEGKTRRKGGEPVASQKAQWQVSPARVGRSGYGFSLVGAF